ncbi:hypothetical protein BRYFOR_07716 [Marvinbryantia formatexigens DSM 14469]|uniref:Uncharacterized protein n=1 Tax=Marvinbryantia formatexigens DSM 14469 TaxID=478749 RepID=C6LGF6_9FIRM|nr:hypothetical protein BRYFOR_07716 [Marvinbryantia formatexigens DSM 14469]
MLAKIEVISSLRELIINCFSTICDEISDLGDSCFLWFWA